MGVEKEEKFFKEKRSPEGGGLEKKEQVGYGEEGKVVGREGEEDWGGG